MALTLLDHFPNLYIGFTGVVTFKKADDVIAAVRGVPLDRILLETVCKVFFSFPIPYFSRKRMRHTWRQHRIEESFVILVWLSSQPKRFAS